MELYLILAAILGIFVAIFAIQNAVAVTVKFLIWEFQSSLAVLIIISMLAGMLLVFLLSIPGRIKRRKELYDKQKKIRELERRLAELEAQKSASQTSSQEGGDEK
ncbi:MAG: LapA family protein [Thermodesulfobacteria bacterium]|nr:LapA family protein [Thermodesulfobacteriota bacterium]